MKITVIGSGYVGLVAGAGFAMTGNTVRNVDKDAGKIARLQAGEIPIFEPGLDDLVRRNVKEGRLGFSTDVEGAIAWAKIIFIAVGTPSSTDGSADLSAVDAVAGVIGDNISGFTVIVIKSTVPIGTNERVTRIVGERTKERFAVVSNPEFLKEGDAVSDFMKPDRVVLGTNDPEAREIMRRLYLPLQRTGDRIYLMDPRSAEVVKYVSNAYLATRISFINEVANLCERVGANMANVRQAVGADQRIGPRYLFPSCGYGGSCFPKDVQALLHTAAEYDFDFMLLKATHAANERQKQVMNAKLAEHFGGTAALKGKTIAIWGLAFKAETDDVRESAALVLAKGLVDAGATVRVHDPEAMTTARAVLGDTVEYCEQPYDCTAKAHALAVCTEWQQYRSPDFEHLAAQMVEKVIVDGRNLYAAYDLVADGWSYYGIGVGLSVKTPGGAARKPVA
jgi:UDPglucose 6-dehydrogenase